MGIVKQIGRYSLPLESVAVLKKRSGFRGWWKPGYDAVLKTGRSIHFTDEEKQQYDKAMERHGQVRQVYGMCKTLGFRG